MFLILKGSQIGFWLMVALLMLESAGTKLPEIA